MMGNFIGHHIINDGKVNDTADSEKNRMKTIPKIVGLKQNEEVNINIVTVKKEKIEDVNSTISENKKELIDDEVQIIGVRIKNIKEENVTVKEEKVERKDLFLNKTFEVKNERIKVEPMNSSTLRNNEKEEYLGFIRRRKEAKNRLLWASNKQDQVARNQERAARNQERAARNQERAAIQQERVARQQERAAKKQEQWVMRTTNSYRRESHTTVADSNRRSNTRPRSYWRNARHRRRSNWNHNNTQDHQTEPAYTTSQYVDEGVSPCTHVTYSCYYHFY